MPKTVTLEMPDATVKAMEELGEIMGTNLHGLIRCSLSLLSFVQNQMLVGGTLILRGADGVDREVRIPDAD
jgi:hypothetical protein